MSRRFTYSAILVVALTLIAAAGFLYARGTGGYESATGHKSISHEAPPRTIDPRIARQMPLADASSQIYDPASSQIYELWQREGLQGFTGMRFDNDKGEVILYWKGQVPHRMVALVRTLRTSVPVRVVERPYSLVELQREARRLVELDLSGAGVNVTQAGPIPDFSGIGVGIDTTARLDSAQQIDRARQVIESDFLLEFTVAPAPEPLISQNR